MSLEQLNEVIRDYAKCTNKSYDDAWMVVLETISNYEDYIKLMIKEKKERN